MVVPLLLSVRSNTLLSDLPLLGAMRSHAKMNQKRKHEEHIKYMHYPTFSNRTYGLTSV